MGRRLGRIEFSENRPAEQSDDGLCDLIGEPARSVFRAEGRDRDIEVPVVVDRDANDLSFTHRTTYRLMSSEIPCRWHIWSSRHLVNDSRVLRVVQSMTK